MFRYETVVFRRYVLALLLVVLLRKLEAYKKDEKDHVENYRPISLLCIISKVLERCVLNRINDRLEDRTVSTGFGVDVHVSQIYWRP